MPNAVSTDELRQHELVILRRLRKNPLTEFELCAEIAESSGYNADEAADRIGGWLEDLQTKGYIWYGKLFSQTGQSIHAAALTRRGRQLVA